jgi:short-subunit dehydrogenase
MRDPERAAPDLPFTMLAMEISDVTSIDSCIRDVLDREGRIDAVVNCVNQMFIGSVEEQTLDEVRSLYETNVFGVLAVCQRIVPVMREQGYGTIVNMSSLGGLFAVPYMSAYTSAKSALEAMTESLHHELRADPIDVVIMQPVAMRMDRPALGAHLHTVANLAAESPSHRMVKRMAADTEASTLTPEAVAESVCDVLERESKPLRVPLGRAKPMSLLKRLAPQAVVDRMIGGLLPE